MGSFLEPDRRGEVSTGGQEGWAEVRRFTFRKEETQVCGVKGRVEDTGKREALQRKGEAGCRYQS